MTEWVTAICRSAPAYRLGWALIHTLWLGAAAAAAFAVAMIVLRRRSANARYLLGCLTLALLAAAPVVAFQWTAAPVETFEPKTTVTIPLEPDFEQIVASPIVIEAEPFAEPIIAPEVPVADRVAAVLTHNRPAAAADAATDDPPAEAASAAAPNVDWWTRVRRPVDAALPWVVGLWSVGVIVLGLWNLAGWIATRRLRRLATRFASPSLGETVARLAAAMRVSRPVQILESALVRTPAVVGWLRPVILAPVGFATGLTATQIEAILAHELAHIRRYDNLVNLLQVLVETLLFYHPAVWYISRRIRLERENCCDDAVVAGGRERIAYAQSLLEVARRTAAGASPSAAVAATGKPSHLRTRVGRLLGGDPAARLSGSWAIAAAAVVVLVSVVVASGPAPGAADGEAPKAASATPNVAGGSITREQAMDLLTGETMALDEARRRRAPYLAVNWVEHNVRRGGGLFGGRERRYTLKLEVANVDVDFAAADGTDYWAATDTAGWSKTPTRKTSLYYWTVEPDRIGSDFVFRAYNGAAGVLKITSVDFKEAQVRRRLVAPGRPAAKPRRFIARMANGATVEVIGLARNPSGPGTWWAPDGTPLPRAPYINKSRPLAEGRRKGRVGYEMVYRVDVPDESRGYGVRASFRPNSGSGSLNACDEFGNRLHSFSADSYLVGADQKTASFKCGLSFGDWRTVLDTDAKGGKGPEELPEIEFGPLQGGEGRHTMQALVSFDWNKYRTRIVGVAADGAEHEFHEEGIHGDAGARQYRNNMVYEHHGPRGDAPVEIVRLRFQYCPFESVSFENLSLASGRKTEVRIADSTTPAATKPEPKVSGATITRNRAVDLATGSIGTSCSAPMTARSGF